MISRKQQHREKNHKKQSFPFTACFNFSSIMAVQQATKAAANNPGYS